MKTLATILTAGVLALTGTVASAETLAEKGEARLAKMIEGRTAGQPVSCISTPRSHNLQVIERVGLVYDAGDTIYVARAENPNALRGSDAIVIERFGGLLCRQDVKRTFDRFNGNITGVIFLSDFVPYKRNAG